MKLHHQLYFDHLSPHESGMVPVIIIPGLFGSCGNWRGFAKELSKKVPVVVVDQRNHGLSPHSNDNSYFDLASDLKELIVDLDLSVVSLCGHSMGGKTAMVFALMYPQLLSKLVVLDIAPIAYSHSHDRILEGMMAIDLDSVSSRSQVDQTLMQAIPDKATRMFVLLSLAKTPERYVWRLNTEVLYNNLELIVGFPSGELNESNYTEECLFVSGGNSNYIDEEGKSEIERFFPSAKLEIVWGAGHWLHIDKRNDVIEKVWFFLKKE